MTGPRSHGRQGRRAPPVRGRSVGVGFTLIELLVVLSIVAVVAGMATLALREPDAVRVSREAARLATLLESARAEARSDDRPVRWWARPDGTFAFDGLPRERWPGEAWLASDVVAEVLDPRGAVMPPGLATVRLGPEPLLPPQSVRLRLGAQQAQVDSDGVGPFAVRAGSP